MTTFTGSVGFAAFIIVAACLLAAAIGNIAALITAGGLAG